MDANPSLASQAVALVSRGGSFDPDMAVSIHSVFGGDSWDYFQDDIPRLKLYRRGLLTIVWFGPEAHAGCQLPQVVIYVLKTFAFLYQHEPGSVIPRAARQTSHPRTICQTLQTLLAFLGHLFESQGLPIDDDEYSLANLKVAHLRAALASWGGGGNQRLKVALTGMASLMVRRLCPGTAPTWTIADVQQLKFKEPKPREEDNKVLPAPLFRLLSNSATDAVCGFLHLLGIKVQCGEEGRLPSFLEAYVHVGSQLFDAYIELRHVRATEVGTFEVARRADVCATILNRNFRRDYQCTAGEFLGYLHEVHRAACATIALYTGGRYSDLTFFMVDCLTKVDGMWFLMGTHIKHQDIHKPLGQDPWPAIPVMRDAVAALAALSRVSRNPFLLSSLDARGRKRAYSQSGLFRAFRTFLSEADVDGTWTGVILSSQRCRNTLANQLARADVALPYISRHLKHLHSSLSGPPATVTLTYGGIADLQVERAMQAQELRKGMARSLYEKDAPVTGGGGKKFLEMRKEYYRGRMAAGDKEEEILEELVATGLPLSSIGPGFCGGRKDIVRKDGTKQSPPCVGSLACAPDTCDNALITRVHAAVWRKVYIQNERFSKRPELAYARQEHAVKMEIAQRVLQELGAKP